MQACQTTHRERDGEELGVALDVVLLPDRRREADARVRVRGLGRVHVHCGGEGMRSDERGLLALLLRVLCIQPLLGTAGETTDRPTDSPWRYLLARTKDDMAATVAAADPP